MVFLYTHNEELKSWKTFHLHAYYMPGTVLSTTQIPTHLILKQTSKQKLRLYNAGIFWSQAVWFYLLHY